MKYNYTALSTDNQKLTGVLDAESLDGAKEELHKMGLSIISITEITEEEYEKQKTKTAAEKPAGIQTFTFECIDPNGKEINGTIDATDDYSAYRRLVTEYKFKVKTLYLTGASEADQAQSANKIAEFEARIKEEGIDLGAEDREKAEFAEAVEKIDKKVIEEIDNFIISVKKILEEHSDSFSPPFLREIENTLGELERVRTSNNLKHISEVCNQLYELVSHPDQIGEGEGEAAPYQNILNTMKGTSLIKGEFDIHARAAGLKGIEKLFDRILKKLTGKKAGELKGAKEKAGIHKLLSKLSFKKAEPKVPGATKAPAGPGFMDVMKKFFSYLTAPNAILRKTRKQELAKIYADWRTKKKPTPVEAKESVSAEVPTEKAREKADFSSFFMEVDSFIAWLLFFYILYFFLVNFSLEKNFGLPRDFVIKTMKTPLILNITIFLLFAHLIFKLKNEYFRHNFFGSLFLMFCILMGVRC